MGGPQQLLEGLVFSALAYVLWNRLLGDSLWGVLSLAYVLAWSAITAPTVASGMICWSAASALAYISILRSHNRYCMTLVGRGRAGLASLSRAHSCTIGLTICGIAL